MYGDVSTGCQVFHVCVVAGPATTRLREVSFLCPNGTIFNQNYFICDWWFNFDCATAVDLYSLNDEIAAQRDALAGASDQAQYGAPAEYGAASSPAGDYSVPNYEDARRAARRLGPNRGNNRRRPGGQRRGRRLG